MKRLVTWRMIGIHAAGIASIVICLLLSQWQWSRAHVPNSGDTATRIGDFTELSPRLEYLPVGSIGATTSVTGTWLDRATFLMPNRSAFGPALLENQPSAQVCDWVVTPLLLDSKSVIAVVRGCAVEGTQQEPISGSVTVTGVLQPSEKSSALTLNSTIEPLTTELVVAKADASAHDGYLVMSQPTSGLMRVEPILSGSPDVPLHWRNVFYTFNWIFFALVILAMWIRVVNDELSDESKED